MRRMSASHTSSAGGRYLNTSPCLPRGAGYFEQTTEDFYRKKEAFARAIIRQVESLLHFSETVEERDIAGRFNALYVPGPTKAGSVEAGD